LKIKMLSVLLVLVLIISVLCSCKGMTEDMYSNFSIIEETVEIINDKYNNAVNNDKSENKSTAKNNGNSSNESPTLQTNVKTKIEKEITTDDEITEPSSNFSESIKSYNNHLAVPTSEYYQFTCLSGAEKQLYQSILSAVSSSKNIVNTSNLSLNENQVLSVLQKVLSDYPQYFYVSRYCMVAYGLKRRNIRAMVLLYTDGEATDEFDENLNYTKTANRTVINRKIDTLQSSVNSIVSQIPDNASDIIKEKIIHDYVVKSVAYANDEAENIENTDKTLPHAFDLYGAVVEKSAVCEGYAKMFQYLCYCVGINSTQVIGTSNGGNHMWNTAKIDGQWYQIDATWDDSEYISYDYFNLTNAEISKTHSIDPSYIYAPECNSTENSFTNTFAVCITSLDTEPSNYESKISNLIGANDNCLYLYFNSDAQAGQNARIKYLQKNILSKTSDFNKYLRNNNIIISRLVGKLGEYYLFSLNR